MATGILFIWTKPASSNFFGRGSWSWQKMMILAEDDDPCRGWWSWQRIMILAEDHDPGRTACSCWNTMILLGNKEPLFKDHLGTTFGKIRKLISRRLGLDLGSIWLLEAGFYSNLYTATKCRLPYYYISTTLCFSLIIPEWLRGNDWFWDDFEAVRSFGGLNLHEKYIANPFLTLPRARNVLKSWFKTDFGPMLDPRFWRIPAWLTRNTE